MERLPPSEIIAAVSAATPSLPFGSEAGPVLNSNLKLTRGEEFGNSTVAIVGETFPARARGASKIMIVDNTKTIAINITLVLLCCILRILLVRQGHDRAVLVNEVLAGHRLNVFRRDRR